MFDGFGLEYFDQSYMPVLARWRKRGLFRRVKTRMPSVTNANNASICCGVLPEQPGITGNSLSQRTTCAPLPICLAYLTRRAHHALLSLAFDMPATQGGGQ